MKNLRIIQDCSPYYVSFNFDGIEDVVDICQKAADQGIGVNRTGGIRINENQDFVEVDNPNLDEYRDECIAYYLNRNTVDAIVSKLPWATTFDFSSWRGRLFQSGPGYKHIIHKDRLNFGLNFMVRIPDDKCLTTFYKSEDVDALSDLARLDELKTIVGMQAWDANGNPARITSGIDDSKLTPVHTFSGKQSEAVLFNTNIYHNWNNTSDTHRLVGLIRPTEDHSSFEEIRHRLFGF